MDEPRPTQSKHPVIVVAVLSICWTFVVFQVCSVWAISTVDFRTMVTEIARNDDRWSSYWSTIAHAPWQGFVAFTGIWLMGIAGIVGLVRASKHYFR